MDTGLTPKPKGSGKVVGFRATDSLYIYLENESKLHNSTVAGVVQAIIERWYEEQLNERS